MGKQNAHSRTQANDYVRQQDLRHAWKVLLDSTCQMENYGHKHQDFDLRYGYYQQVYSQLVSIIKNSDLNINCKPLRMLALFESQALTAKKHPNWNHAIKNLHYISLINQRD